MHRLASKALHDYKGLSGNFITGKPIAFIRKAFLVSPATLINALYSRLATVTQILFIIDGEFRRKILNAISLPYIVSRSASDPIITYPGEITSLN